MIPSSVDPDRGPISPELALVCPELRERARLALPDRPWEAFLPVPAPVRAPSDRARPLTAFGRTLHTVDASPIPRPAATPTVHRGTPRPRRAEGARRALLTPAIVALALAAIWWASQQTPEPVLLGASASAHGPTAQSPAPGHGPAPSGGYLFSDGAVVVDSEGRTATLTLWQGCGTGLGTPPMLVVNGRFHFVGWAQGSRKVHLDVEGRFLTADTARLAFRLRGGTCRGSRSFVDARLS